MFWLFCFYYLLTWLLTHILQCCFTAFVELYDCPSAGEVTLNDMGKIDINSPQQNTTKHNNAGDKEDNMYWKYQKKCSWYQFKCWQKARLIELLIALVKQFDIGLDIPNLIFLNDFRNVCTIFDQLIWHVDFFFKSSCLIGSFTCPELWGKRICQTLWYLWLSTRLQ